MDAMILLGAPGSGKGTAAEDIVNATDYIHVSTGHIFREAIAAGSELGAVAKTYMDKGQLVPDDIVMEVVEDLLHGSPPDSRYMFDGFPRTESQASLFDELLKKQNSRLTHVMLLEVDQRVILDRIAGRRVCRDCGFVYHIETKKSRVEGLCDQCGGAVYQRPDDNEETVLERLEIYNREVGCLIDFYEKKNLIYRIDAETREGTRLGILNALELNSEPK